MVEDLERFSGGESVHAAVQGQRRSRVRRWAGRLAALCILGLGLFGGYLGWQWWSQAQEAPQESDPEQLFRAMEEKISAAKALEVAINGRLERAEVMDGFNVTMATEFQASLLWADGNKGRFEFSATIMGQVWEMKSISNGTKTKQWERPPGKEKVTNTDKYENDHVAGALRRTGMGGSLLLVDRGGIPRDKKSDEWFQVSEFKLATTEKIGMRQGQGIEYKLSIPDGGTFPVKLWIDTETLLPLKRVIAGRVGKNDVQVTESYEDLRLDPPIEAERFQVLK